MFDRDCTNRVPRSTGDPVSALPAQPAPPHPEPKPDATWTIEALLACAMAFLAEAGILARKTTLAVLRAGLPLWLLRERLRPERKWCQFQKDHNLPRTSVWEAIELHLRATERGLSEEEVVAMPWPEPLAFFGIAKRRAEDIEGPVKAEPVEEAQIEEGTGQAEADPLRIVPDQAEQHGGDSAVAIPAEPAKAKKAERKDQVDLTPCEIDAATAFIKTVGGWDRALRVLELVKAIIGG